MGDGSNDRPTGHSDDIPKEERRAIAYAETRRTMESPPTLREEDIQVVNLLNRLGRNPQVKRAAEAIWFDSDPSDHFSDRDPTDPIHGGTGPPINTDIVFWG